MKSTECETKEHETFSHSSYFPSYNILLPTPHSQTTLTSFNLRNPETVLNVPYK